MSNYETLLAKGNSNKQEAKELTQLIDDLKNTSLRIDLELSQPETKHGELEKELENVKAAIDRHNTRCHQTKEIGTAGQSQRRQSHLK